MMVPLAPLPVGLHRCRRGLGRWMPLAFEERGSEATKRRGGGPRCQLACSAARPATDGWCCRGPQLWMALHRWCRLLGLSCFLSFLLAFWPWGQQVDMRTTLDGWE